MSMFLTCQVKSISIEAGLPNITGTLCNGKGEATICSGAFTRTDGAPNASAAIVNYAGSIFTLDASRSSTVYGNSTTVTPLSESTLLCVKY